MERIAWDVPWRLWSRETRQRSPSCEIMLGAAKRGDADLVQQILSRRNPPDAVRTRHRETALMLAAERGHRAVVEALLCVGASSSLEDNEGCSALSHAATAGRSDLIELMARHNRAAFQRRAGAVALNRAALNRHWASVHALLQGGVSPDARFDKAPAPLIVAAASPDARCVLELLNAGGNHRVKDANGKTPLHWAALTNNTDCVRFLLSAGADRTVKDKSGKLPMDLTSNHTLRELLKPTEPEADELEADQPEGFRGLIASCWPAF